MNHWLTILTLVPFFGGLVVAGLGSERKNLVRNLALTSSLLSLGGAICMWLHFDAKNGGLQFVEKFAWLPSLGIQYFLGVDGLGALMVLLTAMVTPLAILASWNVEDRPHVRHAVYWLSAGVLTVCVTF